MRQAPRFAGSFFVFPFLPLLLALLLPEVGSAHETWVLTPAQMAEWDARPMPEIFTSVTATNITIYGLATLFLLGWILLHYTGARELFPDLRLWLASYGGYSALALRVGLGLMLLMAAFGLNPRHGTGLFEAPTFAAPDLELRLLDGSWQWIAGVEAVLAFALLFGIYVRGAAAAFLVLAILGLYLFPYEILAYFGIVAGAAIYLLLQGPGSLYVPMPAMPGTARVAGWLADQPRERAQWLLRISAGLCFTYLGIEYKFLHANYMMALVELHDVPTFGFEPQTFVLFSAIVETVAGLLMVAGVLMRPLAIVLLLAFIFFSVVFREGVLAHSIAYGVLITYALNGAGHWRRPIAVDRPGKLVILGGGFAGVHCAMKLERLLGEFTNVTVTLAHSESSFLFHPLLPEVVGGTVQPGNIVNPIRRICPHTRFLQGQITSIDYERQTVEVARTDGDTQTIEFDQLVIALERQAEFSTVPGLLEHGLPIMTIGDALFLRQRVLEAMERAEESSDAGERQAALTFCVIGAGVLGSGTAAELRELINSALVSYPGIESRKLRVVLVERAPEIIPRYRASLGSSARRRLTKLGVEVLASTEVSAVTAEGIVLSSGDRITCDTVVGAMLCLPAVLSTVPTAQAGRRVAVNEFLQIPEADNIFVAGECAALPKRLPFLALREMRMGARAAYNAWAATQGYKPRRWSDRTQLTYLVALGRHATVGRFLGVPVGGIPAWLLARLLCLLTLPGLERNLRILIDWALDVVFRNDIVVLAPERTHKLCRAHYEPGDVIIREGDEGTCAYFIDSGEVEVVREVDGELKHLRTQKSGECFGEIALLSNIRRTTTVRCLSPVDVTIVPRDQFMHLTEGYRNLANALKSRMAELRSRGSDVESTEQG